MMRRYCRERHLKKIRPFVDDAGLIKVVTGICTCGKSRFMETSRHCCIARHARTQKESVEGP